MNGLTQFYKTYKNPLPNLSVVEAAKIMIKRCMKFVIICFIYIIIQFFFSPNYFRKINNLKILKK